MAQRDKVKELIGRGLHSYHIKALQQIDRIKKKNKEQNHKISILTNELDNDYLTKTEEGSVVSLEHSKEGMVYIDELQGNTLVNYCTDSSKEMTLNGDIDVEGTFVTTTEGVDDGKVDVMCEGNTLVNLIEHKSIYFTKAGNESSYGFKEFSCPLVKPNTTYTIIVNITKNPNTILNKVGFSFIHNGVTTSNTMRFTSETGYYCFTLTTLNEETPKGINFRYLCDHGGSLGEYECDNLIILEGDYTNQPIPQEHFMGIKSVGQDDENGHKIEILSRNKNIFDGVWSEGTINVDTGEENGSNTECKTDYIYIGGFTRLYKREFTDVNLPYTYYKTRFYDINKNYIGTTGTWMNDSSYYNVPDRAIYMRLVPFDTNLEVMSNVKLVISNSEITDCIEYKSNKKEILLNEPLRSTVDKKDIFEKINNKWFIKRNCREIILNGSENWVLYSDSNELNDYPVFYYNKDDVELNHIIKCDKIPVIKTVGGDTGKFAIGSHAAVKGIRICINLEKLESRSIASFKKWLQANPVKVVYQLETPIYEQLEVDSVLNTYNNITHISNNSLMPCNMKIQNSGYNVIIKPSTLYTVALDTNKSGTIGMNLGGTKATTAYNVATITTPATLCDDSLRLYGKGINGSKIRLLEGDKTNWIPSHFEGIKSSFEDKFQDDGTYKMEILSNNKNLLDINNPSAKAIGNANCTIKDNAITLNGTQTYQAIYYFIPVKIGETYTVSCSEISNGSVLLYNDKITGHNASTYIQSLTKNNLKRVIVPKRSYITVRVSTEAATNTDCIFKNLSVQIGSKSSISIAKESNKIQFSSIQPLRSVENTRDRFVFKDNKLTIERNCGIKTLNGLEEGWSNSGYYEDYGRLTLANIKDCKINSKFILEGFHNNDVLCQYSNYLYVFIRNPFYKNIKGNSASECAVNWLNYLKENNKKLIYELAEPQYEEIPYELQKIILEGYEDGTLFFDTNIPPTSAVTYAGEAPLAKAAKSNKIEVLSNTEDINNNILPYIMDMDYRIIRIQLMSENTSNEVALSRLLDGGYNMLKRDILSKRLTEDEYKHRLSDYFEANKITEDELKELEGLI